MCSDMMELLEFCLGSCFWQALHSALLSLGLHLHIQGVGLW